MPDNSTTRRRGQVEAARAPFAPTPRALLTDPRCSMAAKVLWGVLDGLAFERVPPEIDIIAERMATECADGQRSLPGQTSIYRWANELEAAGWLDWDRRADRGERWKLRDGSAEASETRQVRRIRAVLATHRNAESALNEIAAILTDGNSIPTDGNSTPTDGSPSSADGSPTSADGNMAPTSGNPSIYRDGATPFETASDTMPTPHPNDDGDGVAPTQKRRGTTKQPNSRNHPPNSAPPPSTPLQAWLREEIGVSAKRAAANAHHDEAAAHAEMLDAIGTTTGEEREHRIGRVLKRWEVRPPRPTTAARDDEPINISRFTSGEYGDLFKRGDDMTDLAERAIGDD